MDVKSHNILGVLGRELSRDRSVPDCDDQSAPAPKKRMPTMARTGRVSVVDGKICLVHNDDDVVYELASNQVDIKIRRGEVPTATVEFLCFIPNV